MVHGQAADEGRNDMALLSFRHFIRPGPWLARGRVFASRAHAFAKAFQPDLVAVPENVGRLSWIVSPFHGNGETIHPFVFTQFRTENRFTFFLELL